MAEPRARPSMGREAIQGGMLSEGDQQAVHTWRR